MQVLMMPDFRPDNPYQALLEKALQQIDTRVSFPVGYRRLLPFYRGIIDHPNKVDVLHLHWLGPYLKGQSALVRWFYAIKLIIDIYIVQISGIKVVWTVHNLTAHDTQHARLELWVRRQLAKIVNQLIVHNQSSKETVTKLYQAPDDSISVIPIGHYRDVYSSCIENMEARRLLDLPSAGNIYLWQGILRPYKGVETLLKLWAEHQETFADNTLVIAGPVFDEAYGEKITELAAQIPSVCAHLEFIEDDKLHLYFSAASVVILPFKQILTSSSLVLAMSYGKPVIAPHIGGIPETLAEAGELLYDPSDEQGLLHAIKESMIKNLSALEQEVTAVCDRMSWDVIAQKTAQLYLTVRK